MFKAKAFKVVLFAAMFFSLSYAAFAERVSEAQISEAFDEVVFQKFSLNKSYFELTPEEIENLIVPMAAVLFKETIDMVHDQYKADISAQDIWSSLAPNVEKILIEIKDIIDRDLEDLPKLKK